MLFVKIKVGLLNKWISCRWIFWFTISCEDCV